MHDIHEDANSVVMIMIHIKRHTFTANACMFSVECGNVNLYGNGENAM